MNRQMLLTLVFMSGMIAASILLEMLGYSTPATFVGGSVAGIVIGKFIWD